MITAFKFPNDLVPQIDGDLNDWGIVDDTYVTQVGDFVDLVQGVKPDPEDLDIRLMVGWNEALNRLYIAAQRRDDLHQVDRAAGTASSLIFQDDDLEVFVDADHSGGQYADWADLSPEEQIRRNGVNANHFVIAGPPPDDIFFINFSAASWYAQVQGSFTAVAYKVVEGRVGGAAVTNYEMMLVPFDVIDVSLAELSREHVMEEGQILGFNAEFNDFDSSPVLFDAKWSLSGGQNGFRFSERFTDLLLMPFEDYVVPSAVKIETWGLIKASFVR